MKNIHIKTSQNVVFEHASASVGERLLATVIDVVVIYVVFLLMIFAFSSLRISNKNFLFYLLLMPVLFYSLIFEVWTKGQSLGKKALKLRVVRIDGRPAGFFDYFIRWIFRLTDITISLGSVAIVSIVATKKSQRIGDLAAGTTVIRFNPKIVKGELYKALPDNYSLQFAGVANLKAKDINTINEIVTYTQTSLRSAQSMELAQKTKEAICKKLNITTDMGSTKFLKTILQDYSYLQMTNGQ